MDFIICIPSTPLMIGALVAMPALSAQARAEPGKKTWASLAAMMLIYGLMSFGIGFALSSRMVISPNFMYLSSIPGLSETSATPSDIGDELWRRVMTPPPLRQPCQAREPMVCELADIVAPTIQGGDWGWKPYMWLVGKGILSAALTVVLIWASHRYRADEPEVGSTENSTAGQSDE